MGFGVWGREGGQRMDDSMHRLLSNWLDRVKSRPGHPCGVFAGDDGQPFGARSRPWDEPDLLIDATLREDGIELVLDCYGTAITSTFAPIISIEADEHPWGPALRVSFLAQDEPREVWLV